MKILNDAEIAEVVAEAKVAHIGVIADGDPYVTPVSFAPVGDGIGFRSRVGRRLDAIAVNPRVSVEMTVHDSSVGFWRSVVATGVARIIDDVNVEADIIQRLMSRYAESFDSLLGDSGPQSLSKASVVLIEFDSMDGRSSGSSLEPHTRPGRL